MDGSCPCEFAGKCVRRAYSLYLVDIGYTQDAIPDRLTLVFSGHADGCILSQSPRERLYCERFPHMQPDGPSNLCPLLTGGGKEACREYKKERKYLDQRERARAERQAREGQSPRKWIPKETRKLVAQRAGYKCEYCGQPHGKRLPAGGGVVKCVVDHHVPLAQGGHPTDHENLVFACRQCNSDKGAEVWAKGCRKAAE